MHRNRFNSLCLLTTGKSDFTTVLHFFCVILFTVCLPFGSAQCRGADSAGSPQAEAVSVQASQSAPVETAVCIKAACELIYEGKFDAAGEMIKQSGFAKQPQMEQLGAIVRQYQSINQGRESERKAAFAKGLAELERFPLVLKGEANQPPSQGQTQGNKTDANDSTVLGGSPSKDNPKDVNDPSQALEILTRLLEYADEQQKKDVLSKPLVKKIVEKAIEKAAEFERKGNWLEAYTSCYWWLAERIEPENGAYTDHADQLLEKANMVASFQNSPCESSEERFQGVKKEMFERALDVLSLNYVTIIDYRQMAVKAVKRCSLLVEVMKTLPPDDDASQSGSKTSSDKKSGSGKKISNEWIMPTDEGVLKEWTDGLNAILDEVNQAPMGTSKEKFIEIFEKVLELNNKTVKVPEGVLIVHFVEASLLALDPYTSIIWPRQLQDFEKVMTNEFTGIGIEISREKGLLTVASLLPDTPAYNSGLDAEDVIEAVNGVPTKDMSLTCAVKNITGPAGTKVTLTIRRLDERQTKDIIITRAKITVPTVRGWERTETGKWLYMIDDKNKIGYVRITNFSEKTASDFENVLNQLEKDGLKGLVLDLRLNAGGILNGAVEIADKFIDEGLIVSTRPRFGVWTYAFAQKEGTHPNCPLVILINAGSASASEIVAGALADPRHKRAILVGERTYGKGSVQTITRHPGGGAELKYTMAYYHLPSGRRVESQDTVKKQGRKDWGIGPNAEVALRTDEMKKMIDVQRDNDVLAKAGRNNNGNGKSLKKHSVEETLKSDPQLAVGVLVIKSELIEGSM